MSEEALRLSYELSIMEGAINDIHYELAVSTTH